MPRTRHLLLFICMMLLDLCNASDGLWNIRIVHYSVELFGTATNGEQWNECA